MSKIDLNKLAMPATSVPQTQSFAERARAAIANGASADTAPDEYASMVPNRVALMLDCSGSMSGSSIEDLKSASMEYIQACNFSDTSLSLNTFGLGNEMRGGLCRILGALIGHVSQLRASGSTPMYDCVVDVMDRLPLTRALLVSDGQPDNWADDILNAYHEAGIPIDCVHIGGATSGEALLRKIAERTGGIFIKFKNTGNFAKAFKYLSPAYKAQLGDGRELLKSLGADEVR
jgi:uncharacterized protein YegL